MTRKIPSLLLPLALMALLGSGCIKANMSSELKDDGSGSVDVNFALTEKMVAIVHKMEKADPKDDTVKKAEGMKLIEPTKEQTADLAKQGLKIKTVTNVNTEKELSSGFTADFARPDALSGLTKLSEKGDKPMVVKVTRDDAGIYTMSMVMEKNDDPGKPEEPKDGASADPKENEGDGAEGDGAKKMADSMALMGEMMGEMSSLEMKFNLTVPGQLVDFNPATGATQEGNTVHWKLDFAAMMSMSMEQGMQGAMAGAAGTDSSAGGMTFEVRFKLPEGKELPANCWTKAAAKPVVKPAAKQEGDDDDGDMDNGDKDNGGGDDKGGDKGGDHKPGDNKPGK